MELVHFSSAAELLDAADLWDDLWQRSLGRSPAVRAANVHDWVEQFAPDRSFVALAVKDAGRLVAALPLVGTKLGKMVEVGALTSNPWSPCGDLLLDETIDVDAALKVLVEGLDQAPWPLGWLCGVNLSSTRWQRFQAAAESAGMAVDARAQGQVGVVPTEGDWDTYRKTWSKNLRQVVGRRIRRFHENENQAFRLVESFEADELRTLLYKGFEVEDRCWKGEQGSSILRTPGMPEYLLKQSEQMAAWGQLALAFLEDEGNPFAFCLCWSAKGVYYPYKIAYDEAYKKCGPGQLLLHEMLHHMYHCEGLHQMDFLGPLSEYTARWKPEPYNIGRIVVAPSSLTGKAMFYGYKHVWGAVRKIKNRGRDSEQQAAL